MSKPRIFVSHSTEDDPDPRPRRFLDRLVAALEADAAGEESGYQVLLDRKELRAGERWRGTINLWVGKCDAAIVLLTKKALQSRYVAFEVSVLCYREDIGRLRGEEFALVPIFFDVGYGEVADSLLAPSQITEVQALQTRKIELQAGGDEQQAFDATIRLVQDALAGIERRDQFVELKIGQLAKLLENVIEEEANLALDTLGDPVGVWLPDRERTRRLACALLAADLEKGRDALARLRGRLPQPVDESAQQALDLIASTWVNPQSAEQIRTCSPGRRDLALDCRLAFTVERYVDRACDQMLVDRERWPVARVDDVDDEAFLGLEARVAKALVHKLKLDGDADLREELEFRRDEGLNSFVTLSAEGVDAPLLGRLRTAFPGVTFFLRAATGQLAAGLRSGTAGTPSPGDESPSASLEWLRPSLRSLAKREDDLDAPDAFDEEAFEKLYRRAQRRVLGLVGG